MHGASLQSWQCERQADCEFACGQCELRQPTTVLQLAIAVGACPASIAPTSLAPHLKSHADAQMSLLALHAGSSPA